MNEQTNPDFSIESEAKNVFLTRPQLFDGKSLLFIIEVLEKDLQLTLRKRSGRTDQTARAVYLYTQEQDFICLMVNPEQRTYDLEIQDHKDVHVLRKLVIAGMGNQVSSLARKVLLSPNS